MTVDVALINAEYLEYYIEDKRVPSVVLIGRRTDTLEKVMYRVRVKPYLFVEEDLYTNEKPNEVLHFFGVNKVEYAAERTPWGRPLRKLFIKDPVRLQGLMKFLRKYRKGGKRVQLYGAELATPNKLPLRYLLDSGVKSGFRVTDDGVKPVEASCPLRVWLLDFEVLTKLVNTVNPYREEPLIMVTFWDSYKEQYVTVHTHEKKFYPLFPNHQVIQVPLEKHLLLYLQGCLDRKYDPDLIAAHNLNKYDLIKWLLRLEANKLGKNAISPKPFRFVDRRSYPVNVKGRIMCDLLEALKLYTLEEYDSYALEYLTEKLELGIPKVQFIAPVEALWHDKAEVDFDSYPLKEYFIKAGITKQEFRPSYIILLRNVLDVMAIKAYNEKYHLIEFFDMLRKEFGGLFEDMLIRNQMIETGVLRMINRKKALPSKQRGDYQESYKGAFVVEPIPGYYQQVAILDFSREYPSIIQKLNVSPETYVKMRMSKWAGKEAEYVKQQKKLGRHVIYQPERTERLSDEATVTEPARVYVFKEKPRGIIPSWIKRTFRLRDAWEAKEKKAINEGDEALIERCHMGVEIAKLAGNASYGWMSFSGSPLYNKDCSAAVALCGYLASQKLIEVLESEEYQVIYGDTDSVFYCLKSGETLDDVKRVTKLLNRRLSDWCIKEWNIKESPFALSVKMLVSDFVVLSKKRYGGKWYYHEKKGYGTDYDFKGLELVRSDSSTLEKEVQKQVLKYILDRKPHETIKYWATVERKLIKQDYSPIDVAYPSAITKKMVKQEWNGKMYWCPVGYRKNIPAHVKAAIYSNEVLGTDFRQGDKPRRLPVDSSHLRRYPKTVKILRDNELIERPLRDVAIDEYYRLPKEFEHSIDWARIKDRLAGKVDKVIKATGILPGKEQALDRWIGD